MVYVVAVGTTRSDRDPSDDMCGGFTPQSRLLSSETADFPAVVQSSLRFQPENLCVL